MSLSLFSQSTSDATVLLVAGVIVRQDAQGRYCLNDLHKAAVKHGANERTTEPSKFLASPQTEDLCNELKTDTQNLGIAPTSTTRGGSNQGTYVCKELVYAYAMWISARFHLQVIRAYDAMVQQQVQANQPPIMHTPLIADLAAVDALARMLNVAPSGRIAMARVALEHSAPHLLPALPGYAIDAPSDVVVAGGGSSMVTASATELLKRHGVAMSTAKFNEMLAGAGFLNRCQRTSSRGTFKHFWAVTPRGEEFGKNVVSAQNSRETQPHWYVDRFGALLKCVGVV